MTGDAHYDVIIIGSGAGGGTLALKLAGSGKRILIVERGDYLPREKENWDPTEVFVKNRYVADDKWHDGEGKEFQPGVHYCVGGATKMYGAALFRLRQEDFDEIRHYDGVSPGWPLKYNDFDLDERTHRCPHPIQLSFTIEGRIALACAGACRHGSPQVH